MPHMLQSFILMTQLFIELISLDLKLRKVSNLTSNVIGQNFTPIAPCDVQFNDIMAFVVERGISFLLIYSIHDVFDLKCHECLPARDRSSPL